MKKLLCILLSAALLFSFAACKADKNGESSASGSAVSEGENAASSGKKDGENEKNASEGGESSEVKISVLADKEEFTLGEIKDNNYYNKSAGFQITDLGEKWSQTSPRQIAQIYDSGIDSATGKAYSTDSVDGSQSYLYDVMYTNEDTNEVISVSLLESESEDGLSDEIPMGEGTDDIDGFSDEEELTYLSVAGRRLSCKKVSYVRKKGAVKIPNLTEYEVYMMSSSFKQVVKIVIVCFDDQTDVEDILKHFSKV